MGVDCLHEVCVGVSSMVVVISADGGELGLELDFLILELVDTVGFDCELSLDVICAKVKLLEGVGKFIVSLELVVLEFDGLETLVSLKNLLSLFVVADDIFVKNVNSGIGLVDSLALDAVKMAQLESLNFFVVVMKLNDDGIKLSDGLFGNLQTRFDLTSELLDFGVLDQSILLFAAPEASSAAF